MQIVHNISEYKLDLFCVQKAAALERYETAIQEIQSDEQQAQARADDLAALEREFILHKVAISDIIPIIQGAALQHRCFDWFNGLRVYKSLSILIFILLIRTARESEFDRFQDKDTDYSILKDHGLEALKGRLHQRLLNCLFVNCMLTQTHG